MVMHAQGKIGIHDIQDVLNDPRRDFPFVSGINMSEDGLFLQDIHYNADSKWNYIPFPLVLLIRF